MNVLLKQKTKIWDHVQLNGMSKWCRHEKLFIQNQLYQHIFTCSETYFFQKQNTRH